MLLNLSDLLYNGSCKKDILRTFNMLNLRRMVMSSSSMMTGVLVVGSINPALDLPHLGQYITEPATKREPKQTIPVRIAVKKHK